MHLILTKAGVRVRSLKMPILLQVAKVFTPPTPSIEFVKGILETHRHVKVGAVVR